MNVDQMKIGQTLILGSYRARDGAPVSIKWLKADKNNLFLSENAVDWLPVSTYPGYTQEDTAIFIGSLLDQFLQSDAECFEPVYPQGARPPYGRRFAQHGKTGFLNAFEPDEVKCLQKMDVVKGDTRVQRILRLPLISEIYGETKFPLFRRKGMRAVFDENTLDNIPNNEYLPNHFVPYLVYDTESGKCRQSGADCSLSRYYENSSSGIRLVISAKGDTQITEIEPGIYSMTSCARTFELPNSSFIDFIFGSGVA